MKRFAIVLGVIDCLTLMIVIPIILTNLMASDIQSPGQENSGVAYASTISPLISFSHSTSTTISAHTSLPKDLYLVDNSATVSASTQPEYQRSSLMSVLKKIVLCESGNNPYAKNPNSSAKGLLQILDGTWRDFQCTGNVYNPDDNMRCGLKIAQTSGLQHWDASRACWAKLVYPSTLVDNV